MLYKNEKKMEEKVEEKNEIRKPKRSFGVVNPDIVLIVRQEASEDSAIITVFEPKTLIELDPFYKNNVWSKLKEPVNGYVKSEYISIKE